MTLFEGMTPLQLDSSDHPEWPKKYLKLLQIISFYLKTEVFLWHFISEERKPEQTLCQGGDQLLRSEIIYYSYTGHLYAETGAKKTYYSSSSTEDKNPDKPW